MDYKKIEGIAYNLHLIKTNKFKKNMIKINFKNKIKKEDIVKRRMIPDILVESNSIYNTKRLLDIKTEDLYNLQVYGDVVISGESIINSFTGSFLNDKYTSNGLMEDSIKFIFDIIFKPNVKDNKFDTKAFNLSKNSLKEEIEALKENPKEYAVYKAVSIMGKGTSLEYPSRGSLEDLELVNENNLYEYYLSMLRSDIVDIFIIGDIDFDKVEKIVTDNFKINTKKRNEYKHYIEFNNFTNKYKVVKEKTSNNQSNLVVGFKLDKLNDFERQYVMAIYSYILGGSADSKLFKEVREKNSLCYSISSTVRSISNIMLILVGINSKDYAKAIDLIKKQIKSMSKGDFSEEDIERAKKTYLTAYAEVVDSEPSIVNDYTIHEYLNTDLVDKKTKEIVKVTKEDIMKIMPKIHPEIIFFLEGSTKDEEDSPK